LIGLLILAPEILTLFLLNALFLLFGTLAFVVSIKIALKYDANATTQRQYRLEKQSYLAATIIKYIFIIKIPLFLLFVFALENLSLILPGAMCSAGVINATEYGTYLLVLKLINLYLFAYWILLDTEDFKREEAPYAKLKFELFIPLYIFFVVEILLESLMFFSIDIKDVVDCCGVIFSTSDGSYMASLIGAPKELHILLFYTLYSIMFVAYLTRLRGLFSIANILFIFVALISLIGFFGLYIYEMPTHHCPFCILSYDYNYIGYLLYALLFVGTFCGTVLGLIRLSQRDESYYFNLSFVSNTLYALLVSMYVLIYYIQNSVLF